MDVLQFVYPVFERYLNYVPFWTTVIGNSLKILMQVFVWTLVHFSWIYIYISLEMLGLMVFMNFIIHKQKLPHSSPNKLYHFAFLSEVYEKYSL